jgi:excinuclease UvrABC ATPase subunit
MAQVKSKPKIKKVCEYCGSDFFVYPYRKNVARFCKHECYAKTVHKQEKTKNWYKAMERMTPWNKGKKWDKETRKKMSESQKNRYETESAWNKGKKMPFRGENHYNWKGGVSPLNHRIRHSVEYRTWRDKVFFRDNYTCQVCKTTELPLNVHHIEEFSKNEDLRFDVNNGVTLCISCHEQVHNFSFKSSDWRYA